MTLSINRYKEVVYEQKEYDTPDVIIDRIKALDAERQTDLLALEDMLASRYDAVSVDEN